VVVVPSKRLPVVFPALRCVRSLMEVSAQREPRVGELKGGSGATKLGRCETRQRSVIVQDLPSSAERSGSRQPYRTKATETAKELSVGCRV
jgi:hypothetical protein